MPRSRSTFIQSVRARRRSPRALTAPASWIAPPNSSSFSVSVVLPASGCAMIANVRRFAICAGSSTSDMTAQSTSPTRLTYSSCRPQSEQAPSTSGAAVPHAGQGSSSPEASSATGARPSRSSCARQSPCRSAPSSGKLVLLDQEVRLGPSTLAGARRAPDERRDPGVEAAIAQRLHLGDRARRRRDERPPLEQALGARCGQGGHRRHRTANAAARQRETRSGVFARPCPPVSA